MLGGDGEPRTNQEIANSITTLLRGWLFPEDYIGESPEKVAENAISKLADHHLRVPQDATLREKLEAIAAKIGIPVDAPPAQPTRRRYDSFTGELPPAEHTRAGGNVVGRQHSLTRIDSSDSDRTRSGSPY